MTTDVKLSYIQHLMAYYDSPGFNPEGHRVDADFVFMPMDDLLTTIQSVLEQLLETPGFVDFILKEQPSDKVGLAKLLRHPRVSALASLAYQVDKVKAARLWYWGVVGDVDEEWAPPRDDKMLKKSTLEWLEKELEKRGVHIGPPKG